MDMFDFVNHFESTDSSEVFLNNSDFAIGESYKFQIVSRGIATGYKLFAKGLSTISIPACAPLVDGYDVEALHKRLVAIGLTLPKDLYGSDVKPQKFISMQVTPIGEKPIGRILSPMGSSIKKIKNLFKEAREKNYDPLQLILMVKKVDKGGFAFEWMQAVRTKGFEVVEKVNTNEVREMNLNALFTNMNDLYNPDVVLDAVAITNINLNINELEKKLSTT